MKKLSIPKVPTDGEQRRPFDEAMKANLEIVIGHRGAKVAPLKATATQAEIIAKINELILVLQ